MGWSTKKPVRSRGKFRSAIRKPRCSAEITTTLWCTPFTISLRISQLRQWRIGTRQYFWPMAADRGDREYWRCGDGVYPIEISPAVEALVLRKLTILTVFAGVMVTPLVAVHAQEQSQSLGDLARQNRKDKEKNTTPTKTVLTDDNFG